MFSLPGRCWEKLHAFFLSMLVAWNLEIAPWTGASSGSWFDFRIHPMAVVLSVSLRMQGNGAGSGSSSSWKSMSMAEARYSLQLRVKALFSSSVKWWRQATRVFGQYPPIPASDASE